MAPERGPGLQELAGRLPSGGANYDRQRHKVSERPNALRSRALLAAAQMNGPESGGASPSDIHHETVAHVQNGLRWKPQRACRLAEYERRGLGAARVTRHNHCVKKAV